MLTDVQIVNRALSGIGCLPINSFAAPGPAGTGPELTYRRVVDALVSGYPWHFIMGYAALTRLAEAPARGWTYAFLQPPNRLGPARAYYDSSGADRPFTRIELSEDKVFADAERIWAFYPRLPAPSLWPGYFTELVILACQAEYALSIREDTQLRSLLRRDAYGPPEYQGQGGQFAVASELDTQAQPSPAIAGGWDPLTSFRRGQVSADDLRDGWED